MPPTKLVFEATSSYTGGVGDTVGDGVKGPFVGAGEGPDVTTAADGAPVGVEEGVGVGCSVGATVGTCGARRRVELMARKRVVSYEAVHTTRVQASVTYSRRGHRRQCGRGKRRRRRGRERRGKAWAQARACRRVR